MLSLFVYGTLGPNRPNAHIMEKIGGNWAEAHVFGTLKEQGLGCRTQVSGDCVGSKRISSLWLCLFLRQSRTTLEKTR